MDIALYYAANLLPFDDLKNARLVCKSWKYMVDHARLGKMAQARISNISGLCDEIVYLIGHVSLGRVSDNDKSRIGYITSTLRALNRISLITNFQMA